MAQVASTAGAAHWGCYRLLQQRLCAGCEDRPSQDQSGQGKPGGAPSYRGLDGCFSHPRLQQVCTSTAFTD